jgi:hypothetical protein
MRSSRLAAVAVAAGAALLGWSTAGVTALGGKLSAASSTTQQQHQQPLWRPDDRVDLDLRSHGHGHRDRRPGV